MKNQNGSVAKSATVTGAAMTLVLCSFAATAQDRDVQASLEEATAIAAELAARQQSPLEIALLVVNEARVASESSAGERTGVVSSAYEAATARYADSVQALGRMPVPETLNALASAMNHSEASVRLASVVALREGASSRDPHSIALSQARNMILNDPSPAVRRQAFEAYSRWGDQSDVLGLARQLGRAGGPVQDLAVREWIRIEKEFASVGQ